MDQELVLLIHVIAGAGDRLGHFRVRGNLDIDVDEIHTCISAAGRSAEEVSVGGKLILPVIHV